MESSTWPETLPSNRIKAIQELTQGQEWTNKLQETLWCSDNVKSDPTSIDGLVVQILGMFEKTVSFMGSSSFNEPHQLLTGDFHTSVSLDKPKIENLNESAKTVIPVKIKKRSAKRRSYYRCTYKFDQGCLATKQVQMIEDKPQNYKITYFGNHTCNNLQRAPPIILDSPDPTDKSILLNFETKELIKMKQLSPYLPTMKQELKDGLPSLGNMRYNHSSSCNNDPSWDPFTYVSDVPTESVSLMPPWLDHDEWIPSRAYPSWVG